MLDVCTADVPEGDSLPRDIHLFGLAMTTTTTTTTPPPPTRTPSPTAALFEEEEDPFAFGGFGDVFSDVEAPVRH